MIRENRIFRIIVQFALKYAILAKVSLLIFFHITTKIFQDRIGKWVAGLLPTNKIPLCELLNNNTQCK